MTETERQFGEELQELINRYKNSLSTPQIMRIAQPIFSHTIGFGYNPERFSAEEHLQQIMSSGPSLMEKHALKGEWRKHNDSNGY